MEIFRLGLNKRLTRTLRDRTLHRLGYRTGETLDIKTKETLNEALDVAGKNVRPEGIFRILPLWEVTEKGVRTEAGTIRSAMFARLAHICKGDLSIVFMVTTIGDKLQKHLGSDTSTHRQLLFDAVESELTEMTADMLEEHWRNYADYSRLQYSLRLSPGYCDMNLRQQKVIFNALDTEKIGVSLNSHFIMSPSKSISGIAIIAKEVPIQAPCVFCSKESCQWRRLSFQDI